ncbi:non-homologous end-joining DNA ligase [Phosphitispora sp. TUW77]|uniref:non-homologous end-joining DNA ligase n=1 Tax=Phosphitispora sp. TUW77 TaxID=3152361 RepID=UPI003AB48EF3
MNPDEAFKWFRKLKPMLATSASPFNSPEYIFEVKWDGFRCLAYFDDDKTVLQSRNRLDFSNKFPELGQIHRLVARHPAIIDGEIIIMENGKPSFYELQKRGWTSDDRSIARKSAAKPATYVAFDILFAGEEILTGVPLIERKEILKGIVEPDDRLFVSEGIPEKGREIYHACIKQDLEGVIGKKSDSLYYPGRRTQYWKKFKKVYEGDFIICGYKQTYDNSERVDSLILGLLEGTQMFFQGAVGVGLGGTPGKALYKALQPLINDKPLFELPQDVVRGIKWVKPEICCSVEFLETARNGRLRHPVFKGLRVDLEPEDCSGGN